MDALPSACQRQLSLSTSPLFHLSTSGKSIYTEKISPLLQGEIEIVEVLPESPGIDFATIEFVGGDSLEVDLVEHDTAVAEERKDLHQGKRPSPHVFTYNLTNNTAEQKSVLSNLPVDLQREIFDVLPPATMRILGATCKNLYSTWKVYHFETSIRVHVDELWGTDYGWSNEYRALLERWTDPQLACAVKDMPESWEPFPATSCDHVQLEKVLEGSFKLLELNGARQARKLKEKELKVLRLSREDKRLGLKTARLSAQEKELELKVARLSVTVAEMGLDRVRSSYLCEPCRHTFQHRVPVRNGKLQYGNVVLEYEV